MSWLRVAVDLGGRIGDVLVGSTSGVASDREASASPAHSWETACGVCGQTYMTAAAE